MEEHSTVISSKVWYGPHGSGGRISGGCHPLFMDVRKAFEENFALNLEQGSQLSVYHHGQPVVELSGYSSSLLDYSHGHLQNIYSSGKNMEALCVAILVDKGLLQYEDKVMKFWPQFGQFGKQELTISDILRHEGGIPYFADPTHKHNRKCDKRLTVDDINLTVGMDSKIENSARIGGRHYHAGTRGWILSGVIKRVDPAHRTLGQFMREEICEPLGLDIYCGMPVDLQKKHKFTDVVDASLPYLLWAQIIPGYVGLGDKVTGSTITWFMNNKEMLKRHNTAVFLSKMTSWVNSEEGRSVEWPSGGMNANASSVGKLAGLIACGGQLPGGKRLISAKTLELAMSEPVWAYDSFMHSNYSFTKGGFAMFDDFDSNLVHPEFRQNFQGFYGWGGKGGSWFIFNPAKQVGVAYVMNALSVNALGGPRTDRIMAALQSVLKKL